MAHGDAWDGKWRGNWRMEWVVSTVHTTSEHGVSSITTADAHTSAASSRLNWRPRRFKWTSPFHRKTKSGFCACAIIFKTRSTYLTEHTTMKREAVIFTKRSELHTEIHGVIHHNIIFETQLCKLHRYIILNLTTTTTSYVVCRIGFRHVACRPDVLWIVLAYKIANNLHLYARRKGWGEGNKRKCAEIKLGCGRVSEYVFKIPRSLL
jgi:hypothetical protein